MTRAAGAYVLLAEVALKTKPTANPNKLRVPLLL